MLLRASLLCTIVFATVSLFAQEPFNTNHPVGADQRPFGMHANVTGVVTDLKGSAISGAKIELLEVMTGHAIASTYTYPNGSYELSSIPSGDYEIVATSGIYESRNRIQVDGPREVSFRMSVSHQPADGGMGNSVSLSQMKVPGKARKLFQKALEAFRMSHLDDAFNFVQKALGTYPDYAQALTLRGVMNMQRGDVRSAQPDLEKAVELDYSDDTAFVALASLYNKESRFDEALKILNRGLALHPNSWQAKAEKARAEIGTKDYKAALRTLASAESQIPPTVYYCQLFKAQALIGLQDYSGAISELEGYLTKEPTGSNADRARTALAQLRGAVAQQASK